MHHPFGRRATHPQLPFLAEPSSPPATAAPPASFSSCLFLVFGPRARQCRTNERSTRRVASKAATDDYESSPCGAATATFLSPSPVHAHSGSIDRLQATVITRARVVNTGTDAWISRAIDIDMGNSSFFRRQRRDRNHMSDSRQTRCT